MSEAKKPVLGHGQGTILQRPDGTWIGRYYDGYTKTGNRRRREVTGRDAKDVAAKLRAASRAKKAGQSPTRGMTIKAWSDEYMVMQRETKRPATVQTTEWAMKYIVSTIGDRKLPALTPADVRSVHRAVKASEATQLRVHSALMAMLRAAVREGHPVPTPALATETPKAKRSDRADIPLDDALKIMHAASTRDDAARWLLPFLCGLRQGETLGLTWDRVDLDAGVIRVDRQLQEAAWAHGCDDDEPCGKTPARCPDRKHAVPRGYEYETVQDRFILAPVKTSAGERLIPLVPVVLDAMKALKGRGGLVFQRNGGGPMRKTWDNDTWHSIQDGAGVKHKTGRYYGLHEARHTAATLLLALGTPTPVIQAIVGHSTLLSTMTYLHVSTDQARTALESLSERMQLAP